jgi:hypothetical protein
MALPIPRLPPVTMARLPCNPRSITVLTLVRAPVFRSTHQALFSHQGQGASATPYLVRSPGRHIVMDRTGVSPRAAALTGGPDYE